MFFAVEYKGQFKVVKASANSTCTDVFHLGFGGDEYGDLRTKDMRVIGAARSEKKAADMLSNAQAALVM